MTTWWIPVCPSCGQEDWGIKGFGPESLREILQRAICRQCGVHMDGMRIVLVSL